MKKVWVLLYFSMYIYVCQSISTIYVIYIIMIIISIIINVMIVHDMMIIVHHHHYTSSSSSRSSSPSSGPSSSLSSSSLSSLYIIIKVGVANAVTMKSPVICLDSVLKGRYGTTLTVLGRISSSSLLC